MLHENLIRQHNMNVRMNIARSFKLSDIHNMNPQFDLEKGKKMPVGTVSNGMKKVAEGKWEKVKGESKWEKNVSPQREMEAKFINSLDLSKFANHYKVDESVIAKQLRTRISVKKDREKNVKSISINFTDTNSGISIKKTEKY